MNIKFQWTEEMSVNDPIIDTQHKELLNQVNVLLDVIFEHKDSSAIQETVDFLDKYINGHLKYEEEYLAKHMYPDLSEHKEVHEGFIEKYEEFKKRLELSGPTPEMFAEVETFLGDWWIHHIGHEDKKYAEFIESN